MSVWSTRGEAVAVLGAADDAETGDRDHQDAVAGALLLPVGGRICPAVRHPSLPRQS
jgi:hypothetical protein